MAGKRRSLLADMDALNADGGAPSARPATASQDEPPAPPPTVPERQQDRQTDRRQDGQTDGPPKRPYQLTTYVDPQLVAEVKARLALRREFPTLSALLNHLLSAWLGGRVK